MIHLPRKVIITAWSRCVDTALQHLCSIIMSTEKRAVKHVQRAAGRLDLKHWFSVQVNMVWLFKLGMHIGCSHILVALLQMKKQNVPSLAIRLHLFSCLTCNNAKWKYRDFSTDRWSQQPGPECCLNGGGNAPDTVNSVYLYTYVPPSSTNSTNERDAHWISTNGRAVHCKVTFWERDKSGNSLMSLWSPKTGNQNMCRQSCFVVVE